MGCPSPYRTAKQPDTPGVDMHGSVVVLLLVVVLVLLEVAVGGTLVVLVSVVLEVDVVVGIPGPHCACEHRRSARTGSD
jgi:hypothetical protein